MRSSNRAAPGPSVSSVAIVLSHDGRRESAQPSRQQQAHGHGPAILFAVVVPRGHRTCSVPRRRCARRVGIYPKLGYPTGELPSERSVADPFGIASEQDDSLAAPKVDSQQDRHIHSSGAKSLIVSIAPDTNPVAVGAGRSPHSSSSSHGRFPRGSRRANADLHGDEAFLRVPARPAADPLGSRTSLVASAKALATAGEPAMPAIRGDSACGGTRARYVADGAA